MAYELENIVREWMDHLKGLNVEVINFQTMTAQRKIKKTVVWRQSFHAPNRI